MIDKPTEAWIASVDAAWEQMARRTAHTPPPWRAEGAAPTLKDSGFAKLADGAEWEPTP